MRDFYNARPIISRGAVFNFILSLRNKGKTTSFKLRAYKRFIRHGYGTIWLRRTDEETKIAKKNFYPPKLQKLLNLSPDDLRLEGKYLYCKRRGKWAKMIEFCSVSSFRDERSNDDNTFNEIVFDEYQATPHAYNRYRGNEAADFIDFFISKKRNDKMRVFLLGNKEAYDNPYHRYFGIPAVLDDMDGFYHYGNGICLEVNNDPAPENKNQYETKVQNALMRTPYYQYLKDGKTKTATYTSIRDLPVNAVLWCNFDFGVPIAVYRYNGDYYFTKLRDCRRRVVVLTEERGRLYPAPWYYLSTDKPRFDLLRIAAKNNRVYYTDPAIAESALTILQKIGAPR